MVCTLYIDCLLIPGLNIGVNVTKIFSNIHFSTMAFLNIKYFPGEKLIALHTHPSHSLAISCMLSHFAAHREQFVLPATFVSVGIYARAPRCKHWKQKVANLTTLSSLVAQLTTKLSNWRCFVFNEEKRDLMLTPCNTSKRYSYWAFLFVVWQNTVDYYCDTPTFCS